MVKSFQEIWVPDSIGTSSISGKMSHCQGLSTSYIGLLSASANLDPEFERKRILILLSGPEPQRTILEKKLVGCLRPPFRQYMLIRGTHQKMDYELPDSLDSMELADVRNRDRMLMEAEMVICRSGYSSISDLLVRGIPALYIPTPGQYEQLYLADRMMEMNYGVSLFQEELNSDKLEESIRKVRELSTISPWNVDLYKRHMNRILG